MVRDIIFQGLCRQQKLSACLNRIDIGNWKRANSAVPPLSLLKDNPSIAVVAALADSYKLWWKVSVFVKGYQMPAHDRRLLNLIQSLSGRRWIGPEGGNRGDARRDS